jgi:hypothetical protein
LEAESIHSANTGDEVTRLREADGRGPALLHRLARLGKECFLSLMAVGGRVLTWRCVERPVFVVGTGRSGTSILLQALGKHPAILALAGEAPLLTSYGGIAYLFEGGADRDYYAASLKIPRERLYGLLRRQAFETSAGRDWGLRRVLTDSAECRCLPWTRRYWAAKTFPSVRVAEGLRAIYPEARFVYIVRNGLEVVQSMTRFGGFRAREFERHCQTWADDIERYRYLRDCDYATVIRHEDLVRSPQTVFERLWVFLGLEDDVRPVSFVSTRLVHPLDMPTQTTSSVRRALEERAPAHAEWTSDQRDGFKRICGDAMREAGYEVPF